MITRFVKNLVASITAKTPVAEEQQDTVAQHDAEQAEPVKVRTRLKAGYGFLIY